MFAPDRTSFPSTLDTFGTCLYGEGMTTTENTQSITQQDRDEAATAYLRQEDWLTAEEAAEVAQYDKCLFVAGRQEFLVLTDGEADTRAAEYIADSLWAFNPSFLESYMPATDITAGMLQTIGEKCEDGNPLMLALVGDRLDDLTEDAISADGRGHFLNTYDDEEAEYQHNGRTWYVYRIN